MTMNHNLGISSQWGSRAQLFSCGEAALQHILLCLRGAQTVTAGSSSQEKDKTSDGDTIGPAGEPEKSHSNSSTLSDRRHSDSSLCSIEEEHRHVYDMVHNILLSTRDNVNFVNEVFHQVQWGRHAGDLYLVRNYN